jgi:crossover junction endodeoxyribonuclease RuvC
MVFLGIDPGLRKTGWAIIKKNCDKLQYIASGVIKTIGTYSPLLEIFNCIDQVIFQYNPSHAAIENTYVNENPISSLKLAQARGAAIIACAKNRLIPSEYQASTIKKVVAGKGNGNKADVYKMITLQLGYISSETYDESDAIAIAMCDSLFQR